MLYLRSLSASLNISSSYKNQDNVDQMINQPVCKPHLFYTLPLRFLAASK